LQIHLLKGTKFAKVVNYLAKKARVSQGFSRLQHRMEGVTSIIEGHQHLFSNVTDLLIRIPRSHKHTFQGITNTTSSHRHSYSGMTGPAINGQGANHFHRFRIFSQISAGHRHIISGRTTVPILINGVMLHGLIVEKVKRVKVNKKNTLTSPFEDDESIELD
jgi:hypothetical protein